MEEKIIESVRQNPFLYDKRKKSYKNIDAKDRKWKEIAADLFLPVETVKKGWVTLRDRYNREKKTKVQASGSGAPSPKKEWKFFQLMKFLDDTPTANSMTSGNYELEESFFAPEVFSDECYAVPDVVVNATPCSSSNVSSHWSRRSARGDLSEELMKAQNEMSEVLQLAKSSFQSSSSTQLFFASVAASIDEAKLPPHTISAIKLRVQSVVHEEILKHSSLN